MALTTPTPAVRYFQPGLSVIYMLPTVAAFASTGATLAEIGAGTDLSADVAGISGFALQSADLPVPDLGTRFEGSIPGRTSAPSSSIDFWASATGADRRSVLTVNLDTYLAFYANGGVTGSTADYYHVRVSSQGHPRDLESAAKITISFTVIAVHENLLYPTS